MPEKRKPTQKEVALAAGCSQSTVSYVILRTKPISPEVVKRVHAAIDRLGYRPYRVRHTRKPRQIACISVDSADSDTNNFFQKAVELHGFVFRLVVLPNRQQLNTGEVEILTSLDRNPDVTGIICAHPYLNTIDLLARCKSKPCVIFNREGSILSRSCISHERLAEMALKICRQLKYPEVGALTYLQDKTDRYNYDSFETFLQLASLRRNNLICHVSRLDIGFQNLRMIDEVLERWYAVGVRLILCWHTEMCQFVLQWAYRKRLWIPDDLSLFAVDLSQLCDRMSPPVSAIVPPTEALIELCVEDLLARIKGEELPERILSPRWIDRGSAVPLNKP